MAAPRKRGPQKYSLEWFYEKKLRLLGLMAVALMAIGSALWGAAGAWKAAGLPVAVTHNDLNAFGGEIHRKIDESTGDLKRTVGRITTDIGSMTINMMEDKRWALINQKNQQAEQIAALKIQRQKNPADPFLLRRELEVDNWAKLLDRQIASTEDRIEKLKRGEK